MHIMYTYRLAHRLIEGSLIDFPRQRTSPKLQGSAKQPEEIQWDAPDDGGGWLTLGWLMPQKRPSFFC